MPLRATLKKDEGYVYNNYLGKRKKNKNSSEQYRSSCRFKNNVHKS